MSSDISRQRFDPTNDFSSVLMQQGRVQLDADWNEWNEILDRRWRSETIDIIGRCVVPLETPNGFEIQLSGGKMTIGRGRIYVHGLQAENHGAGDLEFDAILAETRGKDSVPYDKQPYFPKVEKEADLPKALQLPQEGGPHLVYVDVWEREVTYVEDPNLVENAVGVDTTSRLQTAWQVRVLPDVGDGVSCATPDDQVPGWLDIIRPSAGRLTTKAVGVATPDDPCLIPPSGGYRGLENRTYRVEIHDGGAVGVATFKWSRDNGSVATGISAIEGDKKTLTVDRTAWDSVRRFSPGDWVEITDDWREFSLAPGDIRRIATVVDASRTITLDAELTANLLPPGGQNLTDPERHTRIKRWDQRGPVRDSNGATFINLDDANKPSPGLIPVPAAGTSLMLENGIKVTFTTEPDGGSFRSGDYWISAARAADASVEELVEAPPRGIHHHYCRLALITFPNSATDCRKRWPPLTESVQAFHVIAITWSNDEFLDANTLGLAIAFDAPPDPSTLNNGAFVVSVEVIREDPTVAGGASLRDVFVLDGVWQMISTDPPVVNCSGDNLFNALIAFQNTPKGQEARVRVRLLGNKIWTYPGVYLDGQAFGKAGTRADGTTRIDLNLPSGSGAKASDFESWFYLLSLPTSPLQVTHVQLILHGAPPLDIDPPPKPQQDQILITGSLQEAVITFNRPPDPGSVTVNTVFVFDGAGTKSRVQGTLTVSGNTVHLGLGNPIVVGSLEVAGGVDNRFTPPTSPVTEQDDGTALDGNYDGAAGGDFVLPFSVD